MYINVLKLEDQVILNCVTTLQTIIQKVFWLFPTINYSMQLINYSIQLINYSMQLINCLFLCEIFRYAFKRLNSRQKSQFNLEIYFKSFRFLFTVSSFVGYLVHKCTLKVLYNVHWICFESFMIKRSVWKTLVLTFSRRNSIRWRFPEQNFI